MLSPSYLLAVIFISIQGSCGQIVMTQTPDSISVSPGQTVTITCTSSSHTGDNIGWYKQKSRETPAALISQANIRHSGVSDRFTGSTPLPYTQYRFTINNVNEDDAADYYCQQYYATPLTQ
ncbi:hypothetical protein AB205_0098410 [Aquarana catesbeiana]|uniref:Ig-like domain-containing protein n=1 Tax=Aquarana catesbeiana TaxID=8400 RepID=A0A2G9QLJ4_AQUCT|nr:hypothetical protein AB205_0122700 [Aquarana catesbeiana]PIO16489.1 hypothetical protein AB205_0098410 [Aquarana catesbeiana]